MSVGAREMETQCHSMTGYGAAQLTKDGISMQCEVKGVNGRYLDIVTRFPREYGSLELLARKQASECCGRGRIEIFFSATKDDDSGEMIDGVDDRGISVSGARFNGFFAAAEKVLSPKGLWNESLQQRLAVDILLRKDIFQDHAMPLNIDVEAFSQLLALALKNLRVSQRTEGDVLCADILSRRETIMQHVNAIEVLRRERRAQREAEMAEKFKEFLKEESLTAERIVAEVALLMEKIDVEEEIVRLRAHLGRFDSVLMEALCGKKLDFLLQECLRETNTIASKIQDADAQSFTIEIKSEIERIKEQVQNLE